MKINIIHAVCGVSAKFLKEYLEHYGHNVSIRKPFDDNWSRADGSAVFSLGCSAATYGHKVRINTAPAIAACVDKRLSFAAFNRAKVDTVGWTTEYAKIPKEWEQVVVRKSATGRKAEDLEYLYQHELNPAKHKSAALYTECFYGRREYRIVVFMGKVVGRYHKHNVDGEWIFNLQKSKGFEKMDLHCIRAAKALGIDYVGFDVMSKDKETFAILEANSGALMQHEPAIAIAEYFNNL